MTEPAIEPAAEVMQGDLGGEATEQPAEGMGALAAQAEGSMELTDHGFDDLAQAGEPLDPCGRLNPRAVDLGRADRPGRHRRKPNGRARPAPRSRYR